MTSRKKGRNPAASRVAPQPGRSKPRSAARSAARSAGMSVARAITKTTAVGSAPAKASRAKKPRLAESRETPGPSSLAAPRSVKARGSYRTSSRNDQQRLADLKLKLGDPDYMEGAILRIATVLSARLTLR
jgi:hypothetical protein